MRSFRFFALVLLLLTAMPVRAEWRQALPGYRFAFPRDHAAHPEFKTEWWYYTGHLTAADGRAFGYQITFFRTGVARSPKLKRSRWALRSIYFAHFALTGPQEKRFRYFEKASRGALGTAGAATSRYRVWLDDWEAALHGRTHRLKASAGTVALSLDLTPAKPPVIHGQNGVSAKSEGRGRASHYYSLTRLAGKGTLKLDNRTIPVQAQSWMDHEFGSNQLAPDQVGWDWFSLQLEDGTDLMLYRMRLASGKADRFSSGTLLFPNGKSLHLRRSDFRAEPSGFWQSRLSGGRYPVRWRIEVPSGQLALAIEPTLESQELMTRLSTGVTYWEGSVRISGKRQGKPTRGVGYMELTGYAEAFRKKI
ncbi:MAG: carotenoid 1,2-hydratase [Armatimonadetes bacterium]|nr:carotenoid 1,2-hydratase [Armatimonadota bacterium]